MRTFSHGLIVLVALAGACGKVASANHCDGTGGGICDVAPGAVCVGGRCAVPSSECPSGYAFAEDEESIGGECVAADPPDASFEIADAGEDAVADGGADATEHLGAWGMPQKLLEICTGDHNETAPSLRADGLEIYFHSDQKHTGEYDIYVATRASTNVPFGSPEVATVSIVGAYDVSPVLSKDGLTLWFASTRSGGQGSFDIYMSTRANISATWSAPSRVTELNTASQDLPSSITSDGLLMGVTSNRDGQGFDLYAATRSTPTGTWSLARVVELDTMMDEQHPSFSDDRLRVYFTAADKDLYTAERSSAAVMFGSPVRIEELRSDAVENHVKLAADERTIWFTSTRDGTEDIFESRR